MSDEAENAPDALTIKSVVEEASAAPSSSARLAWLGTALRRLTGADLTFLARRVQVASEGTAAPDFLCVVADACEGINAPSPGTLISGSPLALRAASAKEALRETGHADVVLEALLHGVEDTLAAPLMDASRRPVGLAIGLSRGRLLDVDPGALQIVLDLAGEALGGLTRGAPPAGTSLDPGLLTLPNAERAAEAIASVATMRRLLDSAAEWVCRIEFNDPLPLDSSPDERADRVLSHAVLTEVNTAFAERFGRLTPSELEGTPVRDVEGFWLTADHARLAHLAASGFDRCEMTVIEPDAAGRSRTLLSRLTAEVDSSGIRAFWCIERDVTEQEDTLLRYRDTAELYGSALRASFDANCVIDADRSIVECDESFANLLGSNREVLVGAPMPPLALDGKVRGRPMDIERTVEVGAWRGRGELTREGGTVIPVDALLAYFPRGRGYVHCFLRDLRGPLSVQKGEVDHQQALAQVARLSTLGEMTSGIAHELNQPLAAIVNYANGCVRRLDQQGVGDEVLVRAMRSIVEQSRRAAEIIRRMRSFARRSDEKREPFSLADLLAEAVEITAAQRRRAGIELETELHATPDDVVVDGIQIEQVALHLLRNAIDALERTSEDHPRSIRIETRITSCPGTSDPIVEASIIDSGLGVPVGEEVRLFDPFYTTRPEGLGLGLTISRSIVESHGGRLRYIPPAESPSSGTCFRFTLPLRTAPIES